MDSSCDSLSEDEKVQNKSTKYRKRSPDYYSRHESKSRKGSVKRKNSSEQTHVHSSKGKESSSSEYTRNRHRSPRRERKHSHDVYNHRSSHSHGYESFRSRSRSPKRSRSKSLKRSRSRSPRRSRSRSPRKSRSRSPRRYKYTKDDSPKRRSSFHFERSPRRSFDGKPNKFSLLEKMGIELKIPAVEKEGPSTTTPSYLNPLGLTASKYAEQIAKRKLLWKNKTSAEEERNGSKNSSLWQGARFSQDQDGKLTAKFQRLMGIKNSGEGSSSSVTQDKDLFKKQEELFSTMEMQYEVARATTHTQRGVGLGFSHRHVP
uniref:Putative arginine/serine-rich coiled-coil 2 n=2 Tax=Rhodnius TaxID=13248 RepID=R4FJ77_RHOPR